MRRNRGLIGIRSDVTTSDATGIFDTFDAYNAERNNLWPSPPSPYQPVTSGLILNLDADDSSSYGGNGSTWSDVSGYGYDFTINGATFTSGNPSYFLFDGSSDYITRSNFFELGGWSNTTTTRTVECGFYMPSSGGGYMVTNERSGSYAGQGWYYITPSNCFFELHTTLSSPYVYKCNLSSSGLNNLNTNGWNIISYSVNINGPFNYATCGFMLNGHTESVTTNNITWGTKATSDDNVDIGRRKNYFYSTNMFDGRINYVRIYGTNLTSTQQLQNYNAFKDRFGL